MLIDWFTVAAQIINFLILAWLLKRYLFTPILKALDERENRIANQIAEADKAKNEALNEKEDFRRKNEELDSHRKSLMKKNEDDADSERVKLFDKARGEVRDFRLKMDETLKNEQQVLYDEISYKTRREAFEIARKTMSEIASSDIESAVVENFIRKLDHLQNDRKELIKSAIRSSAGAIRIRSASPLQDGQRKKIETALGKIAGSGVTSDTETAPELVCGIELIAKGYKLSWNIQDYIDSMEKHEHRKS